MKHIYLLFFLLCSIPAFNQKKMVGIRAGSGINNVTELYYNNHSKWFMGGLYGVSYDHFLNKKHLLEIELLYHERGYNTLAYLKDHVGNQITTENVEYRFNYLSVPIKLGLISKGNLVRFFNFGFTPSVLLNSNNIVPIYDTSSKSIKTYENDYSKYYRKFDIAAIAEFGGGYWLTKKYLAFTSVSFQHSLIYYSNIKKYSMIGFLHRSISLSLGVKYRMHGD